MVPEGAKLKSPMEIWTVDRRYGPCSCRFPTGSKTFEVTYLQPEHILTREGEYVGTVGVKHVDVVKVSELRKMRRYVDEAVGGIF